MLKTRTLQIIDCGDWDNLVTETYGKPYMFQQQDGCKGRGLENITVPYQAYDYENETVPEKINGSVMGVKFSAWLARDPAEWNGAPEDKGFLDLFWERNFYPHVQMVANDLHAKGLIPAGTYHIDIDW